MLSILSREQDPALEEEKIKIMYESAENKSKASSIEKNILYLLQTIQSDKILDDETLIDELKVSKKVSDEIADRYKEAKATQDKVVQMRINYS